MAERKIGSNTFALSPLTAMQSFTLQPRLAPALTEAGVVLAKLAAGDGVAGLLNAEVDAVLPRAIGRFFEKLPPAELEAITRILLQSATMDGTALFAQVEGQGDPFNILMRGRTLDVWRLIWFAVEVNYPDFFALLPGKGAGEKAALLSAT